MMMMLNSLIVRTDLCCILPNPFSFRFCVLAAVCLAVRGIALQLVIEDNDAVIIGSGTNSQGSVDLCLYHNPCCIVTCSHSFGGERDFC